MGSVFPVSLVLLNVVVGGRWYTITRVKRICTSCAEYCDSEHIFGATKQDRCSNVNACISITELLYNRDDSTLDRAVYFD